MRLFTAAERRDAVLDVLKPYESDKLSGNTFIKTPTFDEDYKVGHALEHFKEILLRLATAIAT